MNDDTNNAAREPADDWVAERAGAVQQIRQYRIRDERVLAAMAKVRRHLFIPDAFRERRSAYGDYPWPIGFGQTISQPFIVAYMTERLRIQPGDKILEIGTGSGYQCAVLSELGADVYSVEVIPQLAEHARRTLEAEGCRAHVLVGDGYAGCAGESPFDAIIATCAPPEVPKSLADQLKDGGRMIMPVGVDSQRLVFVRKTGRYVEMEDDLAVRFVPMMRRVGPKEQEA